MPHHAVSRWRFALSLSHSHLSGSDSFSIPSMLALSPTSTPNSLNSPADNRKCKAAFHCHIKVRISWVHCNKIYIWNMALSYLPCPEPFCKAWAGLLWLCRVSTSRGSLREFQGILCKVKLLNLSAFYRRNQGNDIMQSLHCVIFISIIGFTALTVTVTPPRDFCKPL